jgi:hypothetical protein
MTRVQQPQIIPEDVWLESSCDMTSTTNGSVCGNVSGMRVSEPLWKAYEKRIGAVQDFWPELGADDRELIKGTRDNYWICPTCWDLMTEDD